MRCFAYFDASGDETNEQEKFVTVAGFIAHADLWIEWEKEWIACLEEHKILDKYGVPESTWWNVPTIGTLLKGGERGSKSGRQYS